MIRAILTDIEGTTSSLSFVKDVLFPYARERIGDFVRAQRANPAVQAQLAEVRRLADESATATSLSRGPRLDPIGDGLDETSTIAQLERWIDEDRKLTPLKALQGMIWEDGYRRGDFTGHVYEDAVRALRQWNSRGLKLYVYSSGSVLAQKLLFAHTAYGDLTPLFAGYFDTTVGGKREADSYRAIAGLIGLDPGEILFLSDIREELDAARAAGMQAQWLVREDGLDPAAAHPQARDFSGIRP